MSAILLSQDGVARRRCLSVLLVSVLAALAGLSAFGSSNTAASPGVAAAPAAALAGLPLAFEPNQGQADPAVAYFAHLPNGAISFAQDGATIVIAAAQQVRPQPWSEHTAQTTPEPSTNLRLSWPGANPQPTIRAAARLPGYVNYLRGNDPAQWHSNIPTFAALTYHDLYPGIDLRYDGSTSALKGSYLVAPGADPSRIRWRYDGVARPTIDQAGNLVLAAANKDRSAPPAALLTEQAPVAWQQAAGGNAPVAVSFAVQPDGSVGFALGSYDHSRPLVLDPYMLLGTGLGGAETNGYSIAVDSSGAIYVTGAVNSDALPVVNPIQAHHVGIYNAFVTKLNPSGTALVYSTYLGGGQDYGYSIDVDARGQAFVAGTTNSTDYPTTPNTFQPISTSQDCFISVLSAAGSELVYSTFFGGTGWEECYGIAVTADDWATVVGLTSTEGFAFRRNLFASGDGRGFVARFTPSGDLDFATTIPSSVVAYAVALDGQGNAYVAGQSYRETLPVLHAVQPHFGGGDFDGFVLSLSADGSSLRYATYLGGAADDRANGIAVGADGRATVTGLTKSADLLPPVGPLLQTPPIQPQFGGFFDGFVIRLNADGASMKYGTYLGGWVGESGADVAVDSSGAAYVIGSTDGANFPISHAVQWTFGGYIDAFLTKLNPAGSAIEYSTYLGGPGPDYGGAVAVANNGTAYVTGANSGISFPRGIAGVSWGGGSFIIAIGEQCMLSFADVPVDSTFYFYIENLACRGIASGYADGSYHAGASLTRAQLAKIVAGAAGLNAEIPDNQQTFSDVPPADPFWLPIERAAMADIIGGYSCGITPGSPCDAHHRPYYRPAVSVTRGQLAKIVARGMGWNEAIASTQQSFADVAPGAVFWLEVERAHAHGAISGYSCGTRTGERCDAQQRSYYRPGGAVTRAQAAKVVDGSFFPNGDNPAPANTLTGANTPNGPAQGKGSK